MVLEEIFEHGISMAKTVWKKRGDELSRHEVSRMVATDVHPRSRIEVKDEKHEA